jgi:hypothetical protein
MGRGGQVPTDDELPVEWDEYGDERDWDWRYGDESEEG